MRLNKLMNRCGCPDKRLYMKGVDNGPWTCCESCGDAPCQFVIVSNCARYLPGGHNDPNVQEDREILLPSGCLYLLKDCLNGCTWSARFGSLNYYNGGDQPALGTVSVDCIRECQWKVIDDVVVTPGTLSLPVFPVCFWGVDWDTEVITLPDSSVTTIGYAKWRLEIASGVITLRCITKKDGYSATYSAETSTCLEYATLQRTECDPELCPYLPPNICLVPVESEPRKCCEDAEAQCKCNQPGVAIEYDYLPEIGEDPVDPCDYSFVSIEAEGCGGNLSFSGTIEMFRYKAESWPPATLDDSLSYPGESCGAWWGTFSVSTECTAPYNGNVGLLFVCTDDGTWTGKAYCFNTETSTWEYQGDLDITREDECTGPLITFTLPELDCCCPAGCEDCPLPETLTLTGTSGSLTLTYTPFLGPTTYTASGTICGITSNWIMACDGTNWVLNDDPGLTVVATAAGSCDPYLLEGEFVDRITGDPLDPPCLFTITE